MQESNYWQRLARRRVSRRAVLGASATTALGGAAALVVGCGGGGDDDGPTPTPRVTASAPISGGSLTLGRPVTVLGIDPHIDLTGLDIDTYMYPYMYGWRPGAEQAVFNNLAESLEQPDDLTFIFTLKPGYKNSPWTDPKVPGAGEEITSADCKASFIRRGTSISAPDKRFPRKIGKDESAMAAAIQTPDKYTFSFTMTAPFVPAIREMANPTWAIVSEKAIDATLGKGLSQVAYGAGPYMLQEFRGNERIVLVKNPNYPLKAEDGTQLPYLDGLTIVVITDNSSLLTAFKQGQHDVNGSILTKEDYDDFIDNPDYIVATAPSLFYPCVHIKIKPPFDDIKVREALNISINRDEIIQIIQNDKGEYNGPIQWAQFKWALPQQQLRDFYQFQPEKAQQLLADAGYADGISGITMKLPKITGVSFIADIASLLQAQWRDANINVDLQEVELGAFIGSTLLPGNFDLSFFPNLPYDEPDRPLSFYGSLGVTGNGNWNNYANPELDKLIEKQSTQFDETERLKTITEAQEMILQEHGPQLTLTGDYSYAARWWYVHFPYNIDEDVPEDIHPNGCDFWTEEA